MGEKMKEREEGTQGGRERNDKQKLITIFVFLKQLFQPQISTQKKHRKRAFFVFIFVSSLTILQ